MERPSNLALSPAAMKGQFSADFLDEDFCRHVALKSLHGDRAVCAKCLHPFDRERQSKFWAGIRIRCPQCGKWSSALTGTVFSGMQMFYRELVLLLFLVGAGLTNKDIAACLHQNPETVRLWRKKLHSLEITGALKRDK
jgi:transposase-like protein